MGRTKGVTDGSVKTVRKAARKQPANPVADSEAGSSVSAASGSYIGSLGQYNKFVVALAGAAVTGLSLYLGSDNEYVQLAVTILTALGVYWTPNKPV